MSMPTARPAPPSPVSWGVALAAGSLLLIGGGAIVWTSRDTKLETEQSGPVVAAAGSDVHAIRRELPAPPTAVPLHSVAFTMENGTRVVKIKVLETGDELVVDAATGRLLEARPSRPTAPPPAGKFAAPFDPMT